MYRLVTNSEKADWHQKQTSIQNCKLVNTVLMLTTAIPDNGL